MTVPVEHKDWAKHLRELVGGACTVTKYYDENEENSIAIFTSRNDEGILAATIGLMDVDQSRNPQVQIAAEVLMDQRGHDERICNVLSTIAFFVLKDGWRVAPGMVFERMVEMYYPNHPLPHVLFVPPFQWESAMTKVSLTGKVVYPLMAIPISEAERNYCARGADRALESLWESRGTDVLNWDRQSAV
jgi:hypothetical protein